MINKIHKILVNILLLFTGCFIEKEPELYDSELGKLYDTKFDSLKEGDILGKDSTGVYRNFSEEKWGEIEGNISEQKTIYYYVGTTDEVEKGDWVLGRWERENKLRLYESSSNLIGGESHHAFIMEGGQVSVCPNCDNWPSLIRYYSDDVTWVTNWQILCERCGSLSTTKGREFDAIKTYWEVLVKKELNK